MTAPTAIITPAPRGSRSGNRVTALRWTAILRKLGHVVRVRQRWDGEPAQLLVALHAARSAESAIAFARRHPKAPLVVALTGTDLYRDVANSPDARTALALATRLILLQPAGMDALDPALRPKARVIYQSVSPPRRQAPAPDAFEVCVLGHLRDVKDPFRAAYAASALPSSSRIRIIHIGRAMSPEIADQALALEATNPRYRWLGELPRRTALERLARCRLMVLSSEIEGGANAISEAVMAGVPVLATRIGGSIGLLGDDYPGFFPIGDTAALTALLDRAESNSVFLRELDARCHALVPLFDPAEERRRWVSLLHELDLVPVARP